MLVAAYLVGGFLIASVYAVGLLRGRRDRYHRLGFIIPFTVAAIAAPIQMVVGDTLARWVYNNEPVKFAAIELVPKTSSDVPETIFGHLNSQGQVVGGLAIPGLASWLSDPSDGHEHRGPGIRLRPREPTTDQWRDQHGAPRMGRHGRDRQRCCSCCRLGTRSRGCSGATSRRRDCSSGWPRVPASRQWSRSRPAGSSPRSAANRGSSTTISRSHRRPRPTAACGRPSWSSCGIYIGLGTTLILVLRGMSRRWRAGEVESDGRPLRTP